MNDIKINNELISEVFECNCTYSKIIDNELVYEAFGVSYINIYEFAFKCKEWAYEKNYELRSWKGYCACVYLLDGYGFNQKDYTANTEIEAIIKACEWILKEVK